jgi:nucleoside-diphosphate-sugar epimerase
MQNSIVIIGYGATGHATAQHLVARGEAFRIAQRHPPAQMPPRATFTPCDVLDAESVRQAVAGADQVVLAIGFTYDAKVWAATWPVAMANVLDACAAAGARLIFIDNLYMMGPQTAPVREDMPLSDQRAKPAIRSAVTRQWMAASESGRVKVAALRPPDFYGPDVGLSHLGDQAFGPLVRGKAAVLLAPPDTPHDFAYVPDIGRAAVTLLDAPDDAFGQAWNMPCAPTLTPRQILQIGADALGLKLRLNVVPLWTLPILGLGVTFLREVNDMRFTWDRPYHVDASKFAKRFWSDVTPFAVGAAATARSFQAAFEKDQSSKPSKLALPPAEVVSRV